MVLKTFNINEEIHKKFSNLCKSHGLSMSKQVEMFMDSMIQQKPEARQEYLNKVEAIRHRKFFRPGNFAERFNIEIDPSFFSEKKTKARK